MRRSVAGIDQVLALAQDALRSDGLSAEHHPVGFGNENWRLRDTDGSCFVLKIGDSGNAAKWIPRTWPSSSLKQPGFTCPGSSTSASWTATGADLHLDRRRDGDQHPARDGQERAATPNDRRRRSRTAHRRARLVQLSARRIRADVPTWRAYVDHRLTQIRSRCEETGAVEPALLDRACGLATDLAADVDGSAEAVLCHRDLHPDNLIVDSEGALIGIIDWDAAEAWDRAGDWFKLEFDLLAAHPDGSEILHDAYFGADPLPDRWAERRRLVHLVESLNILPNAVTQDWTDEFSDRARAHLLATLDQ
jgi:hypothetical protein